MEEENMTDRQISLNAAIAVVQDNLAFSVKAQIIEALSSLPNVEGWLPISHDTPANQTLILGWRDWRDATWCIEIAPYQTEHRIGAYSSVSCHGSATHYLPTSILPAPPEIE